MKRFAIAAVVVIAVLVVIGAVAGSPKTAAVASAAPVVTTAPSDAAEAATIAGNISDILGLGATGQIVNGDVFVVTVLNGKTPDQLCSDILAITNDPNTASPLPLTSVVLMDHTGPGGQIIAQCRR